jgi:hypothetical protein
MAKALEERHIVLKWRDERNEQLRDTRTATIQWHSCERRLPEALGHLRDLTQFQGVRYEI